MKVMILANSLSAKWHLWKQGPLVWTWVTPVSISWILQPAVANRVFAPNTDFPPSFCACSSSCHTYIVHLLPALIQILLCFPALLEMLHTCTNIWHKHRKKHGIKHLYTQKHNDWTVILTWNPKPSSYAFTTKIAFLWAKSVWFARAQMYLSCKCCITAVLKRGGAVSPKQQT